MKQYARKVKIIAYTLIALEYLVLAGGLGYFVYTKHHANTLRASVMKIEKEKIEFRPTAELKYFYEWRPNQAVVYERTWLPETITRRTNSDGLIENNEHDIEKPSDTFRIIVIGDSFAEGPYVNYLDTYPAKLEAIINALTHCSGIIHYEVINLGHWGYDIEYASHRMLTRGLKYRPDLVLWLVKDDDFTALNELLEEKTDQYVNALSEVEKNDITKFSKYDQIDSELRVPNVSLWEKLSNVANKELLSEVSQEKFFSIQSNAVHRLASELQAPLVLVTFRSTDARYKARMKLWSNTENNVKFYDGIQNLREEETFMPFDWHPNEKGYHVIAESVYRYLIDSKLLCEANH